MRSRPQTALPSGLATLDLEIMQERAASLGRTMRALEEALAALREFDSAAGIKSKTPSHERLQEEAGEALWRFVVQREACGLRNTEAVLRELSVPASVRLRMGVSRRLESR
jgi:hypothetical protein